MRCLKMNDEIVKDVVCGMEKPISQMKFKSDYKGVTHYFCSQQDKDLFEAHPDHWVKNPPAGGERG